MLLFKRRVVYLTCVEQQRCVALEEQLVNLIIMSLRVCHVTDLKANKRKDTSTTSPATGATAATPGEEAVNARGTLTHLT